MTHLDSLWAKTTSDFPRRPPLQEVIPADVVVIGCGFTGVSAAYHLASSGAQVALLEARTIGFGGSGRNVGLVNAGLWTPPDQVEAKLGPNVGKHLNATLANGPDLVFDLIRRHQILCEATRKGTLHCAHSATGFKDLQNRYRQQQERGAPVDLLNPKETARRTGSPAYFGALWDRRAGTIQPLSYVQGLADAAEKRGARIFEGTSALTITEDQSGWTVRTAEGVVHAALYLANVPQNGRLGLGLSRWRSQRQKPKHTRRPRAFIMRSAQHSHISPAHASRLRDWTCHVLVPLRFLT